MEKFGQSGGFTERVTKLIEGGFKLISVKPVNTDPEEVIKHNLMVESLRQSGAVVETAIIGGKSFAEAVCFFYIQLPRQ